MIDQDCTQKIATLNDAICTFERGSGRHYTLILVPHQLDEVIEMSVDGKPLFSVFSERTPVELLDIALEDRGEP